MEHDAKESVRQVPDSPFVLALFESFPEQANLKGGGEKLVGQPLGACPGTRRRGRKVRRKQALRRVAPCPGRVGSGEPSRPAQTQQTHRRAGGNARWRDSGHRKTSVLRMTSGSDVLRREGPPEAAAGKRRRTTPSAPGRMARGTNAGGLNRTAAPGIGGGPHAPTALRTTTVGITDRRGDT